MTRPLKILCLHGYRQSGEQFRTKTGGFRKLFKKKCEYVFINAPHFIPGFLSSRDKLHVVLSAVDIGGHIRVKQFRVRNHDLLIRYARNTIGFLARFRTLIHFHMILHHKSVSLLCVNP